MGIKQTMCQFNRILLNLTKMKTQGSNQGLLLLDSKSGIEYILAPGHSLNNCALWRPMVNCKLKNIKNLDMSRFFMFFNLQFTIGLHKAQLFSECPGANMYSMPLLLSKRSKP